MDEETNKIKQHIDDERQQLGRDLDEIEDRMKNLTDLKSHFNRNTGWFLGAAVAGGFLLSLAVPRPRSPGSALSGESDYRERYPKTSVQPRYSGLTRLHRVSETIDNIWEGLLGVASEKLQSVVADAVPGFRAQYDAIERQRGRSSVHQMRTNPGNSGDFWTQNNSSRGPQGETEPVAAKSQESGSPVFPNL